VLLALFPFVVSGQNETCIPEPQHSYCTDYKLPFVDKDVTMMCGGMMANMSGCEVNNICTTNKYDSVYCQPFSVLKDLCVDMSGMKSCKNYTSMCQKGSQVIQCDTKFIPMNSTSMKENIISICEEMSMPGCEKCSTNAASLDCNVLSVYSNLCMSMPDMSQCHDWKLICGLVPDWPICPSSNSEHAPQMRMYFHTGYEDYVLFKQWVPTSGATYFGTWLAVVFMGILYEFLKAVRAKLEKKWAQELAENYERVNDGEGQPLADEIMNTPFRWGVDLPRALLQFIEVGWGFLLMLVAMTYNVGLFFAVCVGASIGTLLFGRFVYSANYTAKASCH